MPRLITENIYNLQMKVIGNNGIRKEIFLKLRNEKAWKKWVKQINKVGKNKSRYSNHNKCKKD